MPMWKYIKRYLHVAIPAALFMVGEVLADLFQPSMMSRIVDEGVLGANNGGVSDPHIILTVGCAMILVTLLGGASGAMNNVFTHMASQNIGNDIRKDCFRRIMGFSFPQVDRFGTGSLVTRVTNDITQVQNYVAQFVRGIVRTGMLTLGSIFFLFRLNHTFGLIVLCAVPLIIGCMAFCLHRASPLLPRLQEEIDAINSLMQEDASGIRIIKACVREQTEKARFGRANEALVGTQLRVLVIFAFMNPTMFLLMNTVVVILLWTGAKQVGLALATPGVVMAAITYTTQLLNGILGLVMLFQHISRGAASWRRVREVLDTHPGLTDGSYKGKDPAAPKGEIRFRDVSFAFPGSGQTVLRHIDLTIHPGETVAIMRDTGCGKTALAGLIPRFYDVTEGSVLVDGVDVRDYRQKDLRSKVSIALQKSELFSVTIGENIAWGDPDADDEALAASAAIAQAKEFIDSSSDGYNTPVAERGMSLSGGQKQRLSIARAVLKDTEILIFDDATSALDLKTEADLYEALSKARPNATKLIIAQRVASVRRADRIVVLSGGTVEACGTHEELMASCPTYQDIYRSQLGEEGEEHG